MLNSYAAYVRTYDQAYGVVKITPDSLQYERRIFNMTPYLTTEEQKNPTLMNFHHYLKEIQLHNLTNNSSQKDDTTNNSALLQKVDHLFIEMNCNYFTGHNHISQSDLAKLYSSPEFKLLVTQRPRFSKYLKTLYDTTDHSNLQVQIDY